LEHFAQHEAIERKEAEKEAAFAGLSVEEVLQAHEHDGEMPPPAQSQVPLQDGMGSPVNPHDDQGERLAPKYTRVPRPEKADPVAKYINAKKEGQAQGDWGEGTGGYKSPKNPADKMRKNIPYKASHHSLPHLAVSPD
jgi:nucleobindin